MTNIGECSHMRTPLSTHPMHTHYYSPVFVPPVNTQAPVVLAAFKSPFRISCGPEEQKKNRSRLMKIRNISPFLRLPVHLPGEPPPFLAADK